MINNKGKREFINPSKAKRADLTKEFEDFKQKIQEFENKNQQIISRIREACTFKKKHIEQQGTVPARVVYYDRGDQTESQQSSCDYSNNIVYDGNVALHTHPQDHTLASPLNKEAFQNNQYYSNPRSYELLDSKNRSNGEANVRNSYKSSKAHINNSSNLMQTAPNYPPEYPRTQQISRSSSRNRLPARNSDDSIIELQCQLKDSKQKIRQLEEMVMERDEQIEKIKVNDHKFKNYAMNVKRVVSEQVDNFHEEVVIHRLLQFEKTFKKYDNRLKNLNLKIKDSLEDRKANRMIRRSKSKRKSTSRQAKNSSTSSVQMKDSYVSGPKDSRESQNPPYKKGNNQRSMSRDDQEKQKQFAEIAAGYEAMVRSKVEELQRLQKKLRQEVSVKENYFTELNKIKAILLEKDRLIMELNQQQKQNNKDDNSDSHKQIKVLKDRIAFLEQQIKNRDQKEKQLASMLQKSQKNRKTFIEEQKDTFNKSLAKKSTALADLEQKLKQIESNHAKETSQMKEKLIEGDKKLMEKQCELLTLTNRLKKLQADLLMKDQQLRQLEAIITKDAEQDILEKSMTAQTSFLSINQFKVLQDAVHRLEDENDHKNLLIEDLQKKVYGLQAQLRSAESQQNKRKSYVADLEQKLKEKQKQIQNKEHSHDKESNRQLNQRLAELEQISAEREELIEERQVLVAKSNQQLEEIKRLKQQNLTLNREMIKLNSTLAFSKGQCEAIEQKFNKLKEEASETRNRMAEQISKSAERQRELQINIRELVTQLQLCKQAAFDIQGYPKGEDKEEENLLNSLHISEMSFNYHPNKVALEQENAALKQKLRQMEANLEGKENMEKQIQDQYRSNLERIRADIAEKNKEIQNSQSQTQQLKKILKNIQKQQKEDVSFENYKINLYEEKIVQLQYEFNEAKESEQKLNQLLHELTENMRQKSEQRERMIREMEAKDKLIEEMKDVIELRQAKEGNRESIKSSKQKESFIKDISLRISADMSEQFSQQAELSYFSNISDVFKRDDVLQQKMKRGKTTREQFIRLFTKTSTYIKSLKGIIDTKEKRIKTLQRQMVSFKRDDNFSPTWNESKQRPNKLDMQILKTAEFKSSDDSVEEYKDYDSVQIDTRKSKSYQLIKQLVHEKNLAVQENKMLINQIELLQDEITRAEEQENNLVRIKDLYKQEIKKLMEKNQVHTREFETQIKNLREQLDQSEAYHNWEAIKQLFVKMIGSFSQMEDPANNKQKKEEKKKQLEEFIKVISSILRLEVNLRDRLVASLRK